MRPLWGMRNLCAWSHLQRDGRPACIHDRRTIISYIQLNATKYYTVSTTHLPMQMQMQEQLLLLELFVWTLACNLSLSFSRPVPCDRCSAVLPGLGFVSQCLALAASRIPLWMGCECGPNCCGSRHHRTDRYAYSSLPACVFFTGMHVVRESCQSSPKPWLVIS